MISEHPEQEDFKELLLSKFVDSATFSSKQAKHNRNKY